MVTGEGVMLFWAWMWLRVRLGMDFSLSCGFSLSWGFSGFRGPHYLMCLAYQLLGGLSATG